MITEQTRSCRHNLAFSPDLVDPILQVKFTKLVLWRKINYSTIGTTLSGELFKKKKIQSISMCGLLHFPLEIFKTQTTGCRWLFTSEN